MSSSVAEDSKHQATDPCFEKFLAEWSQYVLELNDMTEDELAAGYFEHLTTLSGQDFIEVWRGMSVGPNWLHAWHHTTVTLGIYWSEERYIAENFETAVSVYDERFAHLEDTERPGKLLLRARVSFDAVDVAATVATQLASAEAEVRLKPGSAVELLEAHLDGKPIFQGMTNALA